jgi:hypothetical protein
LRLSTCVSGHNVLYLVFLIKKHPLSFPSVFCSPAGPGDCAAAGDLVLSLFFLFRGANCCNFKLFICIIWCCYGGKHRPLAEGNHSRFSSESAHSVPPDRLAVALTDAHSARSPAAADASRVESPSIHESQIR